MPRRLLSVFLLGSLVFLPLCVLGWAALPAGWATWTRTDGESSMVAAGLLARLAMVVVAMPVLALVLRRTGRSVKDSG